MAINYICEGERLTVVAGSGGIESGTFGLVGVVPTVAITSANEGDYYVAQCCGVFAVTKATGAISQGAKCYWNATNKNITTTASGNTLVGWAYDGAASGDTTVNLKLNCCV